MKHIRSKKEKQDDFSFFTISTSDTGPKLVTNISVLTSVTEPTEATNKQWLKINNPDRI